MTTAPPRRALVITVGPPHDGPWWWQQLSRFWQDRIDYSRISIGNRGHSQVGFAQLPLIALRLVALLAGTRRKNVDYVFTFEGDVTCYLIGLLQYLPGLGHPKHVVLQFISRESDGSLRSRFKDGIARICLGTVHRLVVSASNEATYYRERFNWPASKTEFIPFHTDARLLTLPRKPTRDFIVAAGRSYRDYATLAAAVAGTGIRTIVVCGSRGTGVETLPPEMEVVANIPLDQLLELMAEALVVVLPLEDRRISIGQSVLLQAMALGKALIATRTAGTTDYLRDGEDGLFVAPQDAMALRAAILRVSQDPALATRLGVQARERIVARHLPEHYVASIARRLGCPASPHGDKGDY